MTIKTIINFNFPVGEKELSQDAYYQALSKANSGFYPFGENGLWHGGIHIDEGVLKEIGNDDKLRCMAHGEVIAYRINDVYPKIVYSDNVKIQFPYRDLQKVAYFSTSFTLVRHYLKMPKITGSTETPPSITLYSLYMHQLDWYGYQQKKQNSDNEMIYPHFWYVTSGKVNSDSNEIIKGTAIRKNSTDRRSVVGLLIKGSKIRLGKQVGTSRWYAIVSMQEGTLVTFDGIESELGDITGYIDIEAVTPSPPKKNADANIDYVVSGDKDSTITKDNITVEGIIVYESSSDQSKILGYLPRTASFEFDGQEGVYAKIRKISGCFVPTELNDENGGQESPHQGYVKLAELSSLTYKPEKLDEIVVLKTPVPIAKGNFVGYLGHNVSLKGRFDEPKEAPIATIKRPSDNKLPQLAHIELFTCDDLPTVINQMRTLADSLPEKEQTIILVEKEARLIKASESDGYLNTGLGINFISDVNNYYVKIKPEYTLNMSSLYFDRSQVFLPLLNINIGSIINSININTQNTNDKSQRYGLTQADKTRLINHYYATYPELTIDDIPDEVDLVSDVSRILSENNNDNSTFTIHFILENKHYWIKSKDVSHLQGQSGQLNTRIAYWNNFPLSLDKLPAATEKDTVFYPRTLSIESLQQDDAIAIDENNAYWANITAANMAGIPIKGWVNIEKDVQEHIKRVTPWHWPGFNTIEEKATVGELSDKIGQNKAITLDLEDYTPVMSALHRILTQSTLYSTQRKKTLPPFTYEYLKEGLRRSWTAEQIGHLLLKYESEWYADDTLSKWNEIDDLFEEEKQQKDIIEKLLTEYNITKPYEREYAFEKLDEAHENVKSNWQIEKEQRIKPSLWWKKVAEAQATQSTNDNQTDTDDDTPQLTNLSTDGKAWFIHPVAMIDYFNLEPRIITYHIYANGEIVRYIPKDITIGYEKKYQYLYHDNCKNIHQLGIYDYIEVKNDYYPHKRYGLTQKIHLIDLRKVRQKYSGYGLTYRFNVDCYEDPRFFMNRDTLASFFGAMLEVNFRDISCNGFSTKSGGSGVSKTHRNGYHGDFKYLRKDGVLAKGDGTSLHINLRPDLLDVDRQNQWNDALYKFGWTHMLGWSYTLNNIKNYPHHVTKETPNHNHHLHVEWYDMEKVKEIKE